MRLTQVKYYLIDPVAEPGRSGAEETVRIGCVAYATIKTGRVLIKCVLVAVRRMYDEPSFDQLRYLSACR